MSDDRKIRPSIDHSILSPSGRVSGAARKAALKHEHDRLFPPEYWDPPAKTEVELRHERSEVLRRSAANLRDLASRGMNTKTYLRKAKELETEAAALETAT